jgi:hypothetical protein
MNVAGKPIFDGIPLDTETIPQERLNIDNKAVRPPVFVCSLTNSPTPRDSAGRGNGVSTASVAHQPQQLGVRAAAGVAGAADLPLGHICPRVLPSAGDRTGSGQPGSDVVPGRRGPAVPGVRVGPTSFTVRRRYPLCPWGAVQARVAGGSCPAPATAPAAASSGW